MIIIIILVVLIFGLGGGYWGHSRWGETNSYAGPGIGIGTILIILLALYLLHVI